MIYKDSTYELYKIPKLDGNNDELKINALKKLGLGTRWCTREYHPQCMAETYLKRINIYVIRNNVKSLYQFGGVDNDY